MTTPKAFQDLIPHNHCYGCGPLNEKGLQIKSYWEKDNESICTFLPSPHHSAGPLKYLNGGIIATIMDCHCVCTAMAKAYQMAGRSIGEGEQIWFATGGLEVSYQKPVAIDKEVTLKAVIIEAKEKKMTLDCILISNREICVTAKVVVVKVPKGWFE